MAAVIRCRFCLLDFGNRLRMQMAATVTGSASYITLVCSDTGNGDGDVIDAASQIQ